MIHTNRTDPHRPTTDRPAPPRRAVAGPPRTRRPSDFSDAVVAAYIHEISTRSQSPQGRVRGEV